MADATPQFLTGSSTDRPENPPPMSIFYEVDTGNRYRYQDGEWNLIDNVRNK